MFNDPRLRGAETRYHDPFVSEVPMTREHADLCGLKSTALEAPVIAGMDAVLIATDHDEVDYDMIAQNAQLVIDTRNVMAKKGVFGPHIFKA